MKKSVLFFLVLITGVLVFEFSGCTKKEEEDLTDWAIPRFEEKADDTEADVSPKEETEQAIMESRPVIYVVKKGDSISVIAEQHGLSSRRLAHANGLGLEGVESIIYPGQKLIIPED